MEGVLHETVHKKFTTSMYNYQFYGICIKVFMAINGEEFRQMRNQCMMGNCACNVIVTLVS